VRHVRREGGPGGAALAQLADARARGRARAGCEL
jgi:hypothetical protein